MKLFFKCILLLFILSGCSKNDINHEAKVFDKNSIKGNINIVDGSIHKLKVTLYPDTRTEILHQDKPWEDRLLGYYNVIKGSDGYKLWYMAWSRKSNSEFATSFCFANSIDGTEFVKNNQPNNILNNYGLTNGVLENFVFYDSYLKQYKLIGADKDEKGISRTFIWTSFDGLNWENKTKVLELHHDSQFSVIVNKNDYEVFMRVWSNGKRTIGYCKIDKNYNIIEKPKAILNNSENVDFPHIYNSAVSRIGENRVFFPTLYNSEKDEMIVSYGFIDKMNNTRLSNIDITNILFPDGDIKWGVVSPNLIPSSKVKNEYWMYYYGSSQSHFKRLINEGYTTYYKIRIRIDPI